MVLIRNILKLKENVYKVLEELSGVMKQEETLCYRPQRFLSQDPAVEPEKQ